MKTKLFILLLSLISISLIAQTDSSFIETPITLETKTGKIFGTLCTPKKFDKIPIALIIAGSGPTDRDCNNNMGMKSDAYKMLAHKLSANNIATLRYDKRGIAESKDAMKGEASLRFDDMINDAKSWVTLLKADKRFTKITIIGHSEGSLVGMNAVSKDVDKFISLAGVGESADKVLKRQLNATPSANLPKELKDSAFMDFDSLAAGKLVTNYPKALYMLFRPSVQPYLISWFKHDPQADIKKLTIPILIIQGTSDMQVDTNDARNLSAAAPKAKLEIIKGMNHVLKNVGDDKTANVNSYRDASLPLDTDLAKYIIGFIK